MQIAEMHSHLNGYEHIMFHKPHIWADIADSVGVVDAGACRTKVSRERTMSGRVLLSPKDINECFREQLAARGWAESRTSYWVTSDHELIRRTLDLPPEQQKAQIAAAGFEPILSYNQTDFVKERVAVEVQMGKYPFVAYDMFVKHMAFFVGDLIDVGIEMVPMKSMQQEMSSGVPYYEGALYDLIRQGRGVPAVPLVLIGLAP